MVVGVLQMLEKPALHTDFGGVGVCQGIWERGVFLRPRACARRKDVTL
jgi:hypothetical protein